MALIFCDGFDDGLTLLGKWDSFTGVSVGAPYGRNGSGLRFTNETHFVRRQFAATDVHATMTAGIAFKLVTAPNNFDRELLSFRSDAGATTHMQVYVTYVGNFLQVRRGGTPLATDTVSLVVGQWYYIEFKTTLADSPSGSYELRLNGQTRLQASGIDTKNAGTMTTIDSLYLGSGIYNGTSYMDDVYVCSGAGATNNTFLGDTAIETLLPSGNGNSSLFVGSDGNSVDNYLLVDESVPLTTDYVVGANVTDKDTYAFGNMVRTSGAVKGVMVTSYANKSDTNPRTIKNVARSGASETLGPSSALATTWVPLSSIHETDPNGGGAWSIAAVNGAEFGVEVDT